MSRSPAIFLWVCLIACAAANVSASDLVFTGYARHPQTGALLYIESHHVKDLGTRNERRVVLYRCNRNGPVFARKELSYATQRTAPQFRFEDARLGYLEGLRQQAGSSEVYLREATGAAERSVRLPSGKAIVADAGFDEFVRENWAKLEAGQTVRFQFLVPSRLGHLGFKISKINEIEIEGEAASVIQLNLAGVLGWLLPNIEVSYRQRDRLLMRYVGVTNVRDLASHNVVAKIDFPLAERRLTGPLDFSSLLSEPLVARCPAN